LAWSEWWASLEGWVMAEWVRSCMVHFGSMRRNGLPMFHTTEEV
jgi:hypothetical protein